MLNLLGAPTPLVCGGCTRAIGVMKCPPCPEHGALIGSGQQAPCCELRKP